MGGEIAESRRCANCGALMRGEFCSGCGQRTARRLSLRRSLDEAWEHLADLDFAFARTFVALSTRPGPMVLEYVGGRRRTYSNPFRYAFVITTAVVIGINLLRVDISMPGVPLDSERDRAAVQLLTGLMSYLFFPTIFLLAWFQRRLSRRRRFAYAELLVFDAYCLSHGSLFTMVTGPVLAPGTPGGLVLLLALQLAYLAWCLRGFHGVSVASAAGRAVALTVGYIVIFNLIGLAIVNLLALAGLF